jgi:hypothetical protein
MAFYAHWQLGVIVLPQRPIGDEYWSVDRKLKFMDRHGIYASVIRSAPSHEKAVLKGERGHKVFAALSSICVW